ncbi:DUF2000 family protein [Paenibacillus wynnii]|uniref:DUF2000 domain-containing protein n=1 Tax=Paenibacillus wynnii TaxID=268407 RepID=A0A098M858_9BACL|nr:DUF2000 family protein [Paenibacillus wynnii]KGE18725.1 hypothetical protein PWYN_04585 [Paenibacillus wynnii]
MKRIAIILDKNLEIGAASNVAALLMGQASLKDPNLYSEVPVLDKNNVQHAGIKFSTVILKAGENQLLNLIKSISEDTPNLNSVVFSQTGQFLNNAFDEYSLEISSKETEETKIVGVIVWGEDELVRMATKKYSVLK